MHRNHSQCKTLQATNSTQSTVVLETLVVRSSQKNPSYSASDRPSSVVVKPKQCVKGQIHKSKRTICDSNNRCIQDGIRGSHEFSNSTRGIVTRTKRMTQKSSRDASSVSSIKTFHSQSERSNCDNQVRQFNRGSIYKQNRRNTVSPVMFENLGNMELGICIKAAHVADRLSRYKVIPTEWTLSKAIVHQIFQKWGYPSSVSQACRKRRLIGAVCRNHRIKRLVPCRCLDGHVKEPYEMSIQLLLFQSACTSMCRHIYD